MAVLGILIVLLIFVGIVVGIPMLCRAAIRRMGASQGLRQWLDAYGPRFPVPRRDEPDDGPDA